MRGAVVSGQFYEAEDKALRSQITKCFKHKLGPKKLPGKAKKTKITAAIVPHAGYVYSGAAAAYVYKAIAESPKPDLFVILGSNHTGAGPSVSIYPEGEWETPLGKAKIDENFTKALIKNSKFVRPDESAHRYEHSIEVQLPFLQFLFDDVTFVAIALKGLQVLHETNDLVDALIATANAQNKKIMIIASSDFTHYGPNYMYTPFSKNVKTNLYKMDKKGIDAIIKLKEIAFLKHILNTKSTICGYPAITAAILFAKAMKVKKGKLLKYYTSGDISKDYKNAVGYAGIIF